MLKFACAFLGLLVACPLAATTIYVTQAAFLAELQASYLEDFESLSPGDQGTTSIPFSSGGFSYTAATAGVTPMNLFVNGEFTNSLSTLDNEDDILFTFTGGSVNAVGGNFFASFADETFSPTTVTLSLSDGTNTIFGPGDETDFIGFIASPGVFFTSLNVAAPDFAATALHPNIDNLYVGTTIPEPATFALIGVTLVALGWRASRERRKRNG